MSKGKNMYTQILYVVGLAVALDFLSVKVEQYYNKLKQRRNNTKSSKS